jgi:Fe-S-cluster containining protein
MMNETIQTVRACSCAKCVECCENNTGWMTPAEAAAAIKAGHAKSLMRDWLEPDGIIGADERVYLLAPASEGCEGGDAPEASWVSLLLDNFTKGQCVFLTDGLCSIHDSGFKPLQCRVDNTDYNEPSHQASNWSVARLWNTEEGRDILAMWHAARGTGDK